MTGSGGEVGRLNTGGGKPVILIVSIYAWQLLLAVVYFFSYVRFYHLICSKYKHLSSMMSLMCLQFHHHHHHRHHQMPLAKDGLVCFLP